MCILELAGPGRVRLTPECKTTLMDFMNELLEKKDPKGEIIMYLDDDNEPKHYFDYRLVTRGEWNSEVQKFEQVIDISGRGKTEAYHIKKLCSLRLKVCNEVRDYDLGITNYTLYLDSGKVAEYEN